MPHTRASPYSMAKARAERPRPLEGAARGGESSAPIPPILSFPRQGGRELYLPLRAHQAKEMSAATRPANSQRTPAHAHQGYLSRQIVVNWRSHACRPGNFFTCRYAVPGDQQSLTPGCTPRVCWGGNAMPNADWSRCVARFLCKESDHAIRHTLRDAAPV